LVARKGKKTTHHFAHKKGEDCASAVETAFHLSAKRILSEKMGFTIPQVIAEFDSYRAPFLLADEQTVDFDMVVLEMRTHNIIPDVIAIKNGVALFIEIRVTHRVDEDKLRKIRKLGISAIEIDLSDLPRSFSEDDLERLILSETSNKKWLYNTKAEKTRNHVLELCEKRYQKNRGMAQHIDNCPIPARVWKGKPYANLIDDCLYCDYCFKVGPNMSYIFCGGRKKIKTLDDLKNKPSQ